MCFHFKLNLSQVVNESCSLTILRQCIEKHMFRQTLSTGKCDPGYHVNLELGGCKACEEGYYSNGGTDISCTCCPHGTTVLSGEGTGENSCIPSK